MFKAVHNWRQNIFNANESASEDGLGKRCSLTYVQLMCKWIVYTMGIVVYVRMKWNWIVKLIKQMLFNGKFQRQQGLLLRVYVPHLIE